jgi:hypothetical protein
MFVRMKDYIINKNEIIYAIKEENRIKIMFRESQGCLNFDYPPKSYRMNMDWAAIGRKLK